MTLSPDQFHECNGDPSKGQVCSHLATDDVLKQLGEPVRKVDKIVGTPVVVQEGHKFRHQAVSAAWRNGTVRICTKGVGQ